MSWHYSQALEAAYLAANSSAGALSAPSNGMNMPENVSSPGRTTDVSTPSQSGTMCNLLMGDLGVVWWMSYLGDSRAKILAPQAVQTDKDLPDLAPVFGSAWPESSGKWDQDSSSWKTRQLSLFGGLEPCSEIWPRWGMMRSGEWYPLGMLEHDTSVRGYGSSPIIGTPIKTQRCRSEDFMRPAKNPFELCPKGFLPNPSWVEKLMGWPDGWTDSNESATAKFHKWSALHGTY